MPWWQRFLLHIRALFERTPKQLPMGDVSELAVDLQEALRELGTEKGAVYDSAQCAVRDYADLRDVLMGPGASDDAGADVTLLAEAEDVLRSMLLRAPQVKALTAIASRRGGDAQGRAAAGEALLQLRDQGRALSKLTSASLLWASSQSREHQEEMQRCASVLAPK